MKCQSLFSGEKDKFNLSICQKCGTYKGLDESILVLFCVVIQIFISESP